MNAGVQITTGARLHFGLLDIAAPFGGCGVMIDRPETVVQVTPASEFTFSQHDSASEHRDRAITIARRIAEQTGIQPTGVESSLPTVHVRVLHAAPAHTGLGSGTQLSLAIAEGILRVSAGIESLELATDERDLWLRASDRGRRSAVGTYGYLHGGFIVEGSEASDHDLVTNTALDGNAGLNPLNERLELPAEWRVAIILPATQSLGVVHGEQEQAKFDALQTPAPETATAPSTRDSLKTLLTDKLMPAIRTANFADFCEATTQYNFQSGQLFADVQGGAYNGAATTRLIASLHRTGLAGVGQSSWGPGVFVWFPSESSANAFRRSQNGEQYRVFIARPLATGRLLENLPSVPQSLQSSRDRV